MSPFKSVKAISSRLADLSRLRLLVVGDIMHDVFIWGKVNRISPEAPVPVVEVTKETSLLGGAANVVNNIMALGARAVMAGVIGKDPHGEAVSRALKEIDADGCCIRRSLTRPTAVKTRIIAHQQQVVRFDLEEKRPLKKSTFNGLWKSIEKELPRTDAVIVSDYAKGLISPPLMDKLVPACKSRDIILAVDPKPENMFLYKGASIITPNQSEAAQAAGMPINSIEDLEKAGEALLEKLECGALLITLGEKGMALFQAGKDPVHIPARAREVYDVTGAGDTVIGVLTVAMVAGMELADAVMTANIAAGIVVGKIGTSVASVDEILASLKEWNSK